MENPHQTNPVALAHLGERQTEVQSLNLEVLCSIHRSDKLQCPVHPGSLQLLFAGLISPEHAMHASLFACPVCYLGVSSCLVQGAVHLSLTGSLRRCFEVVRHFANVHIIGEHHDNDTFMYSYHSSPTIFEWRKYFMPTQAITTHTQLITAVHTISAG